MTEHHFGKISRKATSRYASILEKYGYSKQIMCISKTIIFFLLFFFFPFCFHHSVSCVINYTPKHKTLETNYDVLFSSLGS